MQKHGHFIVLEGNQGLGKTTQARLLANYLTERHIPNQLFCFPRYDSFFGKLAAAFLRGEHGRVEDTSPYLVSLIFANDRLLVRDTIRNALASGEIVVADRWVSSNLAVQASKFATQDEREAFVQWVQEMEYSVFEQPQPDLTIYLRAQPETSLRNLQARGRQDYLKGKADIEETGRLINMGFQQYERLAATLPGWAVLNLERQTPEGQTELMSIAEVQAAVVGVLTSAGILHTDA